MTNMSIRIAELISVLNMNKATFAKSLNITRSYVTKLTSGVGIPSARLIEDICEKHGVNNKWLLTGEGEMFKILYSDEEIAKLVSPLSGGNNAVMYRLITSALHVYENLDSVSQQIINKAITDTIAEMKK